MPESTTELPWYCYPSQYQMVLDHTQEHELTVLHEDGLYRHLRFAKPGTSVWHFDLITWPGSLAIRGDIGDGYIFSRVADMLNFFAAERSDGHIDARYWAQKMDGNRNLRSFSIEKFKAWTATYDDDLGELVDEMRGVCTTEEAIQLVDIYGLDWDMDDPYEWEDYDFGFIIALHLILWGAKKYHAEQADRHPPVSVVG